MTTDQGGDGGLGAIERHVLDRHAGFFGGQAGGNVPDGSRGGVADGNFTRIGFGVIHETAYRAVRRVGANRQGGRVGIEAHQRIEILPGEGYQALWRQGVEFESDHADRVAVRACRTDRVMADSTGAARLVDDVDCLAEEFFGFLRQRAQKKVGAAAGGPRANDGHRFVRKSGEGGGGEDAGGHDQCGCEHGSAFHVQTPRLFVGVLFGGMCLFDAISTALNSMLEAEARQWF